jgi:hypothetical protein
MQRTTIQSLKATRVHIVAHLFPHVDIAPFPLLRVALLLHLNPLLRLDGKHLGR